MRTRFALSIVLALISAPALASRPRFQPLGDLPGGNTRSAATAVNADGSVVVGYSDSGTGEEAFRWTNETGMYGLGSLGGIPFLSTARAVSANGRIVFGDSVPADDDPNSVPLVAFRWTMSGSGPDGEMVSLGDLPGGDPFALGSGCSADGNVLVGHSSSTASGTLNADAYRKVGDDPMVSLGDLPGGGYFSVATACSADGSIVTGYSSSTLSGPSSSEAFRWTQAGGLQPLGDLAGGGFGSNAFAISADGSVIVGVGVNATGVVAFRWTQATGMQSIGDLPGDLVSGRANGVSADGSIVVGQGYTAGNFHAFIWTAGTGMRDLRDVLVNELGLETLDGWRLDVASAISADGLTVVGYGRDPNDQFIAWRAHLGNGCELAGDLDFDDDVDLQDLSTLLANFASGGVQGIEDGDIDGNSDVDLQDLALLLGSFGTTCP
jgi:probable HAF family extracellular repeat protein